MLFECFDPEEFKEIFRKMPRDANKFRYYMEMLKLLTYKSRNGSDAGSQGDIDKLLDEMFKVKK